jgi:hypothetical protein
MAKERDDGRVKQTDGRDSTKPGTIVAGPEAHAREGAGQAPSTQAPSIKGADPKGQPAKKPADRS